MSTPLTVRWKFLEPCRAGNGRGEGTGPHPPTLSAVRGVGRRPCPGAPVVVPYPRVCAGTGRTQGFVLPVRLSSGTYPVVRTTGIWSDPRVLPWVESHLNPHRSLPWDSWFVLSVNTEVDFNEDSLSHRSTRSVHSTMGTRGRSPGRETGHRTDENVTYGSGPGSCVRGSQRTHPGPRPVVGRLPPGGDGVSVFGPTHHFRVVTGSEGSDSFSVPGGS